MAMHSSEELQNYFNSDEQNLFYDFNESIITPYINNQEGLIGMEDISTLMQYPYIDQKDFDEVAENPVKKSNVNYQPSTDIQLNHYTSNNNTNEYYSQSNNTINNNNNNTASNNTSVVSSTTSNNKNNTDEVETCSKGFPQLKNAIDRIKYYLIIDSIKTFAASFNLSNEEVDHYFLENTESMVWLYKKFTSYLNEFLKEFHTDSHFDTIFKYSELMKKEILLCIKEYIELKSASNKCFASTSNSFLDENSYQFSSSNLQYCCSNDSTTFYPIYYINQPHVAYSHYNNLNYNDYQQ